MIDQFEMINDGLGSINAMTWKPSSHSLKAINDGFEAINNDQ
jgi:hypothetical protein